MEFLKSLLPTKNAKASKGVPLQLRGVCARYTQNVLHNETVNNDYARVVAHHDMVLAVVADGMGRSANAFAHAKLATDLICEKLFEGTLKQGCAGRSVADVISAIRVMLKEVAMEFEQQNSTLGSESTLVFALVCAGSLKPSHDSLCKVSIHRRPTRDSGFPLSFRRCLRPVLATRQLCYTQLLPLRPHLQLHHPLQLHPHPNKHLPGGSSTRQTPSRSSRRETFTTRFPSKWRSYKQTRLW
eukprot:TRINITY_DN3001_c0_g1_i1.p1 TRINITY_DN3001_c0_g1~~TRINITY_DN3001_c0_g1_i1.p1  ORF type:complete len:271 (-),score=38.28 TRINITY_DN3001_c0_g1_i1:464-1189(-)